MKICMFARSLPAHSVGGMENHIDMLSKSLSMCGCKVDIITTAHPGGIEYETNEGVRIYYCQNTKPGKYTVSWWKESIKKFVELQDKSPYDLIHSQSAGGYYILRKRLNEKYNTPVVVSLHGTTVNEIRTKFRMTFDLRSKLSMLKNIYTYFFWDRFYIKVADAVIATSDQQLEIIKRFYHVDAEKLYLVYNGIDEHLFKNSINTTNLRNSLNIERNEQILLCVARLKKEKGIQNIIKVIPSVVKAIPKIRLLIIGDGEYKYPLMRLSKKLNVLAKINFLGFVPYNKLPYYYNVCDAFVNPTIRENGYDLTILQAMSCGKPVICSNIGSVPTVISDRVDGFLYPKNNLDALAKILINLIAQPEIRKTVGENARKKIMRKFSIKSMTEGTIKVYESILRRG